LLSGARDAAGDQRRGSCRGRDAHPDDPASPPNRGRCWYVLGVRLGVVRDVGAHVASGAYARADERAAVACLTGAAAAFLPAIAPNAMAQPIVPPAAQYA